MASTLSQSMRLDVVKKKSIEFLNESACVQSCVKRSSPLATFTITLPYRLGIGRAKSWRSTEKLRHRASIQCKETHLGNFQLSKHITLFTDMTDNISGMHEVCKGAYGTTTVVRNGCKSD